jgi:hypothetical protein
MKFLEDERGFGVEDSPFMILVTIVVLLLVVAIGTSALMRFVEGNEYQTAAEAATEIYRRARLLSLSYDGSTDGLDVSVPRGYAVRVDGSVIALREGTTGFEEITDAMSIRGVAIESESGSMMGSGNHEILFTYHAKDGPKVLLHWD